MNLIKNMLTWLFSLEGTKAGKLILPPNLHCGGVVHVHTLTQARKFIVDWKPVIASFPVLKDFPDLSQGWDYLVNILMGPQGTLDPEMWGYINRYREVVGKRQRIKDRMMTTAFVDFIVDQLQTETSVFGDFKFHDSGTDATAEAITDTGCIATTAETRSTGTQTETDHDTYKSVATDTYAGSFVLREHCLLNVVTGGTAMDRTVFGAITVVATNQVEYTFEGSFTAGG